MPTQVEGHGDTDLLQDHTAHTADVLSLNAADSIGQALLTKETRYDPEQHSGRLRKHCRKTKMCRFWITGSCRRGAACEFAHSPEEMQPLPDLQRTKVCPTLINTGHCNDTSCTYAHFEDQLRRVVLSDSHRNRRGQSDVSDLSARVAKVPLQQSGPRWMEGGTTTFSRQTTSDHIEFASHDRHGSESEESNDTWESKTPEHDTLPALSVKIGSDCADPAYRPPPLKVTCRKTKLCSFFLKGKCKRTACAFAHSTEELVPSMDLSRTRMCPTVVHGGKCTDHSCKYAHAPSELRRTKVEADPCGVCGAEAPVFAWWGNTLPLRIKNTFLEPCEQCHPSAQKRSKSATF